MTTRDTRVAQDTQKLMADTIYKWIGKNYGSQEMEDPCYDVEELAKELAGKAHEIYRLIDRAYQASDCEIVADELGIDLDDDQIENIVNEFMDSEAYVDRHDSDWKYFIEREVAKNE